MQTCRTCGMPVEFRYIGGACIPLHPYGGCSGAGSSTPKSRITKSDGHCAKSSCPVCKAPVYFIRHNGGSVYLDPPLGPPWPRHGCLAEPERNGAEPGGRSLPAFSTAIGNLLTRVRGLVTGVVVQAEPIARSKQMVLTIAVPHPENLVLVVDGEENRLLGKIVVLRPGKQLLYIAENPNVTVKVNRARFIPPALINTEFPLLTPRGAVAEPADPPSPISRSLVLKKFKEQGLRGQWKVEQLLTLLPILSHTQRKDVAHLAAMLVLEKVASDGNCLPVGSFCRSLPTEFRIDIALWFATFSPIRIDLQRLGSKPHFENPVGSERQTFRIDEARKTPFYMLNPRGQTLL